MENTQNTTEDSNKVSKTYDATIKKLVAIVGGEDKLFPTKKVVSDVIGDIVTGLLKERKEDLEKQIKTDLLSLLDKHVSLKKEIKAKEDEFKKLSETKMKEFSEAANKLFGKIDGISELEKDYYQSLTSTTLVEAPKKVE